MIRDLDMLSPEELDALIKALDELKPALSEQGWVVARALDAEEARRVGRGLRVVYS
jgi:hypothetical protein